MRCRLRRPENDAISSLQLHGSYGMLGQVIEEDLAVTDAPELFCFGLLKDLEVVPRKVSFHAESPRVRQELTELAELYLKAGAEFDPFRN